MVLIRVSVDRDTLTLIESGYCSIPQKVIAAGQTTLTSFFSIETHKTTIQIYPNPAQNQILLIGLSNFCHYSIVTSRGERIKFGIINKNILDVSELSDGLCFLQLMVENQIITHKLVIKKQ